LAQKLSLVLFEPLSSQPHFMASSAQSFALLQLVLLLSAPGARGDFLSSVKVVVPSKFNPGQLKPVQLGPARLPELELPPAITSRIEVVQAAEGKIRTASREQLAEGLQQGGAIRTRTEEEMAAAQQHAAGVLKKGAAAAAQAKLEDVPSALSKVVGSQAINEAKKAVEAMHPERSAGVAGALRGASSQMADAVNQTSLHVSEFLSSFGPKASTMLSRSGEALACKFAGDCNPDGDAVLPFDPEDPESWAIFGFAVFLLAALCGSSMVVLRCMYSAGRKGTILLADALVPLTQASAREPAIQMPSLA